MTATPSILAAHCAWNNNGAARPIEVSLLPFWKLAAKRFAPVARLNWGRTRLDVIGMPATILEYLRAEPDISAPCRALLRATIGRAAGLGHADQAGEVVDAALSVVGRAAHIAARADTVFQASVRKGLRRSTRSNFST